MADISIPQAEADALLTLDKIKCDSDDHHFPANGRTINIPLKSRDGRESFLLDIERASIKISKVKYQNRARQVIVLARLDLGGAPHRNPDGVEMPCPHLHLYREGYDHKWAFVPPPGAFSDLADLHGSLMDFLRYCNVVDPPKISKGLFE